MTLTLEQKHHLKQLGERIGVALRATRDEKAVTDFVAALGEEIKARVAQQVQVRKRLAADAKRAAAEEKAVEKARAERDAAEARALREQQERDAAEAAQHAKAQAEYEAIEAQRKAAGEVEGT